MNQDKVEELIGRLEASALALVDSLALADRTAMIGGKESLMSKETARAADRVVADVAALKALREATQ